MVSRRTGSLSAPALNALREAETGADFVVISATTLIELRYLVEKNRPPDGLLRDLHDRTRAVQGTIRLAPVDYGVVVARDALPRHQVPDMPNRIIGATALALGLQLVTSDGELRQSLVPTIW